MTFLVTYLSLIQGLFQARKNKTKTQSQKVAYAKFGVKMSEPEVPKKVSVLF